jgi:hypothetical protein
MALDLGHASSIILRGSQPGGSGSSPRRKNTSKL